MFIQQQDTQSILTCMLILICWTYLCIYIKMHFNLGISGSNIVYIFVWLMLNIIQLCHFKEFKFICGERGSNTLSWRIPATSRNRGKEEDEWCATRAPVHEKVYIVSGKPACFQQRLHLDAPVVSVSAYVCVCVASTCPFGLSRL